MLKGWRSTMTRCTPRRGAAVALLSFAACSSCVAAFCMVSSGLLPPARALRLSRTFVAATGSESTSCAAPSLSDQAALASPETMAISSAPAPSQRGMCQRYKMSTAGRNAVVSSRLSMMGMNTALAQCSSATVANSASRASDRLRTSTGMWRVRGAAGGGASVGAAAGVAAALKASGPGSGTVPVAGRGGPASAMGGGVSGGGVGVMGAVVMAPS